MFDRRYYTYVKAVSEHHNFTRAAEELYISQPALSRFIKRIESEFDIVLFDREASPATLTPEGKDYLVYMERFLQIEAEMRNRFSCNGQGGADALTITTIPILGIYVLPKVIPSFANQYPSVNVQVAEGTISACMQRLRDGEANILLTNLIPDDPDLAHVVLGADPIMVVGRQSDQMNYLLAGREGSPYNPTKIDFSLLKDQTFIVLKPWQNIRAFADHFFSYYRFRPRQLIEAPSLASALGLVESGKGVTFQTFSSIMTLQPSSNLVYISTGQLENVTSILAVYRKNANNPNIERFCQRAKLALAETFSKTFGKSPDNM